MVVQSPQEPTEVGLLSEEDKDKTKHGESA